MINLLETQNLTKIFNPHKHSEVAAVKDINLQLKRGEILMIMGPSGSGKTTLLTMLGGLLKPSNGSILLDEAQIQSLSYEELSKIRRQKIGFIFQSFNLLQNLSALENVLVASFIHQDSKQKALALLTKLGLSNRLNYKPAQLSGGERQRVAIARALVNNPELILADEPTANLDSHIGHEVMQLLCSIGCEEEKSIIIVSHDERIKGVAHRVIYLEDGQVVKEEKGEHNKNCQMKKHGSKTNDHIVWSGKTT